MDPSETDVGFIAHSLSLSVFVEYHLMLETFYVIMSRCCGQKRYFLKNRRGGATKKRRPLLTAHP